MSGETDNPTIGPDGTTGTDVAAGVEPPGDAGTSEGGSWLDGIDIPDDHKETLSKFSDVSTLAKSYVNLSRLLGEEKIPVPKSDEDWDTVYDRLGRPETPDKYELSLPEEIAEKVKDMGADDTQWVRDLGHKLGLNNNQVNGLYQAYWEMIAGQSEELDTFREQERMKAEQALRSEWLTKFDDNLYAANKALDVLSEKVFGDDTLVTAMQDLGVADDPRMVKLFHYLSEHVVEDAQLVHSGGMTSRDIDSKISEIAASEAYLDKKHPGHEEAVRKVNDLFALKYNEAV